MPYGFRVIKTESLLQFLVSASFSHGPHLSINIVNTVCTFNLGKHRNWSRDGECQIQIYFHP